FAAVVIFPLWLQTQEGYTAEWAGYATASFAILAIVFSPIVGRLSDKVDLRILVTIGFICFASVSFMTAYSTSGMTFWQMFTERLPWGLAVPCFFIPLITLSLSGMRRDQLASASGLFNFL